MSGTGRINRLFKLGAVASLDVVTGSAIAYLLDAMYTADPCEFGYLQLLLRVLSRAFLTGFMGDEVRDFLYPYDFNDPTGGFFFAVAMLWQPQMYQDARLLVAKTIEMIMSSPILNSFPTLSDTRISPHDPNPTRDAELSKPSESQFGKAFNGSVSQLEGWTSPE